MHVDLREVQRGGSTASGTNNVGGGKKKISRLSRTAHRGHRPPGTAMEEGYTFPWRGNRHKLVTVHAARKWSTVSPEESDEKWIYLGLCEKSGLGMFRHRTDEGRLRTGPCPLSTKEPEPNETTRPKKEAAAVPMAPKANVHTSKVSAPSKVAAPKVKASTPMAQKATGTTKPAAKPIPVSSEPASSRQEKVPKPLPAPWMKGVRGETKTGPPWPRQQHHQPQTKKECARCRWDEALPGSCPYFGDCWFGHAKKSKAWKRRKARARQRARARNAASSSAPQASAPQPADPGRVPGNSRPTARQKADGIGVSPARPPAKRPRSSL